MTVARKSSRITPVVPPPLKPTALGNLIAGSRAVLPALARLVGRMVATIAASGLFIFVLLDVSIPGGFRGVVWPQATPALLGLEP